MHEVFHPLGRTTLHFVGVIRCRSRCGRDTASVRRPAASKRLFVEPLGAADVSVGGAFGCSHCRTIPCLCTSGGSKTRFDAPPALTHPRCSDGRTPERPMQNEDVFQASRRGALRNTRARKAHVRLLRFPFAASRSMSDKLSMNQ